MADNVDDAVKFVYTDEHAAYWTVPELRDEDTAHERVNHSKDEWVRGEVRTNTIESVWSLLKRSIIVILPSRVGQASSRVFETTAEFGYYNRRNPYLLRDTLMKLCESEVLGYQELIRIAS